MNLEKEVEKHFGNRLRLRVSGLCIKNNNLLLIRHRGLGANGMLWAPPGGGMEWGSSAPENLVREFWEETGLEISVGEFCFVHEYLKPPLHTVELFYKVEISGGTLSKGSDPELATESQLIQDVSFMQWEEIIAIPQASLHQILLHSSSLQDLLSKRGYYKFSV